MLRPFTWHTIQWKRLGPGLVIQQTQLLAPKGHPDHAVWYSTQLEKVPQMSCSYLPTSGLVSVKNQIIEGGVTDKHLMVTHSPDFTCFGKELRTKFEDINM